MIIAVDGPAASGKGTLARRLAAHYGLRHLDTGLLYRAVARRVLDLGADPADPASRRAAARALELSDLGRAGLRSDARIWTAFTGHVSADALLGRKPDETQAR
jgi:CMP/dCMP kinase